LVGAIYDVGFGPAVEDVDDCRPEDGEDEQDECREHGGNDDRLGTRAARVVRAAAAAVLGDDDRPADGQRGKDRNDQIGNGVYHADGGNGVLADGRDHHRADDAHQRDE